MELKELKNKEFQELRRLLSEKRETLREMRFKVAQRQLKKVRDIRITKKDIARIITIINQKSKQR